MKITFMSVQTAASWSVILLSVFLTLSCGGGGGGGGGEGSPVTSAGAGELSYTGNLNAVYLDAGNARRVLMDSLDSSQASNDFILSSNNVASGQSASLAMINEVARSAHMATDSTVGRRMPTARSIDDSYNCAVGTVHIKGSVNENGTGKVTLDLRACESLGMTLTGKITVTVSAVDPDTGIDTDVTLAIAKVFLTMGATDLTIGGDIRIQSNPITGEEKLTYNVIQTDNRSSRQLYLRDFVVVEKPTAGLSGSAYASSLTGRVYDSNYGYVDIVTETPLVFADQGAYFPDDGGPIRMTGSTNTRLKITPKGRRNVYLEGDFNGDGRYESVSSTEWDSLPQDGTSTINSTPLANPGTDRSIVVADPATFSGLANTDPDRDFISFKWTVTARPAGSIAALLDADLPMMRFTADKDGDYEISMVVTDGRGASRAAVLRVKAITRYALATDVVDAAYSRPLDRVVLVASSPAPGLHLYDPVTGSDIRIALNYAPSSVSISPDGLVAAVGHNGAISYVDLVNRALIRTYTVTADIFNLVLTGNGYIYGFPNGGGVNSTDWVEMRFINIATGVEAIASNYMISGRTKGKQQPGKNILYIDDNSFQMIHWYDISGGVTTAQYRSLASLRYATCGDFWFSEEGLRMFTRCGLVFQVPPPPPYASPDIDLVYQGTIEGGLTGNNHIIALSDSQIAGQFATIETGDRSYDYNVNNSDAVTFFSRNTLTKLRRVPFPVVRAQGQDYPVYGQYVFHNRAGTHTVAVGQADPASGLTKNYYVMHFQ